MRDVGGGGGSTGGRKGHARSPQWVAAGSKGGRSWDGVDPSTQQARVQAALRGSGVSSKGALWGKDRYEERTSHFHVSPEQPHHLQLLPEQGAAERPRHPSTSPGGLAEKSP